MELSSTFNSASPSAGVETASHGETGSSGETSQNFNASAAGPALSANDNDGTANVPPSVPPEATNEAPDEERIDPEVQALNDAQDRRLEEDARISDLNMQARRKLEADLEHRYGGPTRQLRGEISHLQNVLDNSGPIRLGWLKLTRQISQDPHRDLNTLQSTLEMNEQYRAEARRTFEDRIQEEAQARQSQEPQNEPGQGQQVQESSEESYRGMTKEQAAERLAYLEENRPKPAKEAHHRPGKKTEQYVHTDEAVRHEREISRLKAFVELHDRPTHGPAFQRSGDEGVELSL